MATYPRSGLGLLGLLPLETRVRIYQQAILAEGRLIHVSPRGELQQNEWEPYRRLERTYTISTVSASIAHEVHGLNVPSTVCTFVVDQPLSLEALLQDTGCWVRSIEDLEIRSAYLPVCRHCREGRCVQGHDVKKDLAVARTCYSVWDRAFAMLGPRVRLIRFNVSRDIWCMKDRQSIKKRIVKLAAMAAEATDGRVRVRIDGGCLLRDEQRFLEDGVLGIEPKLLVRPCETFGGGSAVVEEVEAEGAMMTEQLSEEEELEAEIAMVTEYSDEEVVMQSIEEDEGYWVGREWYQGSKPAIIWNEVNWGKRC